MLLEKLEGFDCLEYGFISEDSGGYISKNKNIFNHIKLNNLNISILEKTVCGTPIFKMGNKGNKILILSGIHGDELSSQLANLKLLNELLTKEINHTIYFIPFAAPFATMNNERTFKGQDLNRSTHIEGSLSNKILKTIIDLGINFVGDFHSTALNSNPGREAIFSSKNPTVESFLIANYISCDVGSQSINFFEAGSSFKGAVEDECNIKGIPAITGEVLTPFGIIADGSAEKSLLQMKSFLDYFGV